METTNLLYVFLPILLVFGSVVFGEAPLLSKKDLRTKKVGETCNRSNECRTGCCLKTTDGGQRICHRKGNIGTRCTSSKSQGVYTGYCSCLRHLRCFNGRFVKNDTTKIENYSVCVRQRPTPKVKELNAIGDPCESSEECASRCCLLEYDDDGDYPMCQKRSSPGQKCSLPNATNTLYKEYCPCDKDTMICFEGKVPVLDDNRRFVGTKTEKQCRLKPKQVVQKKYDQAN